MSRPGNVGLGTCITQPYLKEKIEGGGGLETPPPLIQTLLQKNSSIGIGLVNID